MVRPEDALQSVRTAIMLGAVLPEMRDAGRGARRRPGRAACASQEIADEKDRLPRDLAALTEERQRISLLVEERQKKQAETEKALEAERQKAVALARQVDNLKDLIGKVEQSLDSAARAARRPTAAPRTKPTATAGADLAALQDPGRLAPAVAFASARGLLATSGQRRPDSGIRGPGRPRRHRKGHFDRHPGRRPGHRALRRLGGLCRTVPHLRPTLDP